jgi:cyclophilin family peptidyl-prolyl cis-trans isomerase
MGQVLRSRHLALPVEPLERRALLSAVAITTALAAVTITDTAAATTVDLSADFAGADVPANTVFFDTSLGLIPVQLTPGATPLTVANFLGYVNAGSYDGSIVQQSVDANGQDTWGGGSYTAAASTDHGSFTVSAIPAGSPVASEYADSHPNVRGTLAMALVGGDPNSATDGWFFNVADNASTLDAPSGQYTTFGNVIGNGLSVMDAIAAVPTFDEPPFSALPLVNFTAGQAVTASNLITVNSIRQASAYTVTSDAPSIVTATVNGNSLVYQPTGTAGKADITVTATGLDDSVASQTFALTVVDPTIGLRPIVTASTVPATVVTGTPVTGKLTLSLTNTTATTDKGTNTLKVYAVPAGLTDASAGTLVATVKVKTNLKPGAVQRLVVPIRQLPTSSGAFTLMAQATNVAGTVVTTSSGPTVTVAPQVVALGVAVNAPTPTTVAAGKSVTFTMVVSNSGNSDSTGKLTITLGLVGGDGTTTPIAATPVTRVVRVKATGKPVVLKLKGKVPATLAAGSYAVQAVVAQGVTAAEAVGTTTLTIQ